MNHLSVLEKRLLQVVLVLIPVVALALYISSRLDTFSVQQRDLALIPAGLGLAPTVTSSSGSGAGELNQTQAAPIPTVTRQAAVTPSLAFTASPFAVPSRDLAADLQGIFKGGQKPDWKLLHGQPSLSGGFVAPSSAEGLTLQIGSETLQSYSASFDIKHTSEDWELVLTAGKEVMGTFTSKGATWYRNQGGWQVIATGPGITSQAETVTFSVDNSTVSVRVNGLPLTGVDAQAPVGGPLVIFFTQRVSLGNLALNHP